VQGDRAAQARFLIARFAEHDHRVADAQFPMDAMTRIVRHEGFHGIEHTHEEIGKASIRHPDIRGDRRKALAERMPRLRRL